MKEYDYRERVRRRTANEAGEYGGGCRGRGCLRVFSIGDRGRPVNTNKEIGGSINKLIKGEDTIDRGGISLDFPVEELGKMPIKGTVRTAKHVVSKFKVGD